MYMEEKGILIDHAYTVTATAIVSRVERTTLLVPIYSLYVICHVYFLLLPSYASDNRHFCSYVYLSRGRVCVGGHILHRVVGF